MTLDAFKQRGKQVLCGSGVIGLVLLFLHVRACLHPIAGTPKQLNPGELAQVHYDNNTHKLTTVTPTKTETIYADNPTIHVGPGGYVLTENHPMGKRFSPFIGVGYGDTARLHLGIQIFHFWRIGINGSLALSPYKDSAAVIPVVGLSYNFYGNLESFVGVNPIGFTTNGLPQKNIQAGLFVRFW